MDYKLWVTIIGLRGIEYISQDIAHLCSLFNIDHSSRTPYSPWTNALVEVRNRNLGTHLRLFLQNPPTNWSIQTQVSAYAHKTIPPLSQPKLPPHQNVFHTSTHYINLFSHFNS